MKKIYHLLLLGLLSGASLQAQNVYDFSGGERPTEPEKRPRERMADFNDFPYLHLRVSPSLALPLGAFGDGTDAPESGFAKRGWGYNADLVLYVFHWGSRQGAASHSFGLSIQGGWSKYPVQEALGQVLDNRYSSPEALATNWQVERADWRGGHFGIGLAYLFLANQRLMMNIEAMMGGMGLQEPNYRIEQGNYIPSGYGSFFGAARINAEGSDSNILVGIYQLGIGYMMTKRWGIKAGVALMHGRWEQRAERYLSTPSATGISLQRVVEDYRKPFVALNLQVGLCLSLGGRWEDLFDEE